MGSRVFEMRCTPAAPDKEPHGCGWSWFSPAWMKRLAVFPVFMIVLCLNAVIQGMVVNGFISTSISSIEKRFSLTSTESGIFSATYDVAVALMLIPLSIYAQKVNKVRSIGCGMLLVGIGALVICIPQFMDGNYKVGALKSDHCDPLRNPGCDNQQETTSFSYPLLLLSQVFVGLGAAPLFTFGYSTIDEFDSHKKTGINMAIFMGVSTVGPALAFIGGGQLLNIWGDIGKTDYRDLGIVGPKDPRWYGAWWIGFAAAGCLAFFTSIPLMLFPKTLNDTEERKRHDTVQTHAKLNVDFTGERYALLRTFKLFFFNKTCMALVAMQTFESMIMNGYITFIPKVFENLFGFSPAWASTMTGLIVVPMGVLGSILGGKAGEMVGNKMRPLLKVALVFNVLVVLCSFALLIRCQQMPIAGVNTEYSSVSSGLSHSCHSDCQCEGLFNPVCAGDISYLSPCHAGCAASPDLITTKWEQCSCASLHNVSISTVTKGWCAADCRSSQIFFFVIFAFMAMFIFASAPVIQSSALRVVSFNHRDAFICFGWMFMRVCGSIPGAVFFGAVIDKTCVKWKTGCDGSATCVLYDPNLLSSYIFYMTLATKALCFFCLVIALYSYSPVADCDDPRETDDEEKKVPIADFQNNTTSTPM